MKAIPVFSWQLYEETFGSRRAEIDSLINDIKDCWGDPLDWLPIDIAPQPAATQLQTQGFRPQNWSLQYLRKLHHLAEKTKGRLDTAHSCMFSVVSARYDSDGPFSDLTRYPHFMAEDMELVERQLQDALRANAEQENDQTKEIHEGNTVTVNEKTLGDTETSATKQVDKASVGITESGQQQQQQPRQQQGKDATKQDDNAEKGNATRPKRSELEERQRIIAAIRKDWPSPPEGWIPSDLRPLRKGKKDLGKEDDPMGWNFTLLKALRSLSNHTKQNLELAQLYMVRQVQKRNGNKLRPLASVDVDKVSEMAPMLEQLAVEIKQRNIKRARKAADLQNAQKKSRDVREEGSLNHSGGAATVKDGEERQTAPNAEPTLPTEALEPKDFRTEVRSSAEKPTSEPNDIQVPTAPIAVTTQSRPGTQAGPQPPTGDVFAPTEYGEGHQTPHEAENINNELFVPEDAQHQPGAADAKLPDQADAALHKHAAATLSSRSLTLTASPDARARKQKQRSPKIFKELIRLPSEDDTNTNFEFMIADPLEDEQEEEGRTEESPVKAEYSTIDAARRIISATGTRRHEGVNAESQVPVRTRFDFSSRKSPPKVTKMTGQCATTTVRDDCRQQRAPQEQLVGYRNSNQEPGLQSSPMVTEIPGHLHQSLRELPRQDPGQMMPKEQPWNVMKRPVEAMERLEGQDLPECARKRSKHRHEKTIPSHVDQRTTNDGGHRFPSICSVEPISVSSRHTTESPPAPYYHEVLPPVNRSSSHKHSDSSSPTYNLPTRYGRRDSPVQAPRRVRFNCIEQYQGQSFTPRTASFFPDCHCVALEGADDDHYCEDTGRRQDERASYEQAIVERDLHIRELEAKTARLEGQLRGKERLIADLKRKS